MEYLSTTGKNTPKSKNTQKNQREHHVTGGGSVRIPWGGGVDKSDIFLFFRLINYEIKKKNGQFFGFFFWLFFCLWCLLGLFSLVL